MKTKLQSSRLMSIISLLILCLYANSAWATNVSKADIDGAIGINVAAQKMDVSGSIADKMPIPVGDVHKPMTADLMFGKQALKTNLQQTGGKTRSISLDGKVATPRKAPTKTAVNVSGLIDASTLADNAEIVLTGNTNLFMNVNKTLKCISGDYTLTISGGNILTINNPNGAGIEVKSLNSTAPLNITARDNAIATTNVEGDITINGNLTAETTGDKYFCIVGKKVTLIGGTMTITSVTNAVVSYGDMILGGDITASVTDDTSGAFNTRDGGNLLIQEGSTINALSAGFGIYAAGNITMPNGSLTARGYSNATVQCNSGNISLTGTINVKGKDCAICAGDEKVVGDITINGNLTAETTGDKYFCIVGKKVTLIGGTMKITSVTNAVVSYGDMILGGDITASVTDDTSGAFNTRDGGNLLIQEGSTINALSAGFGIYAAGNITMPNGSLTARGYSNATVQSNSGNISLTGTINVKGKDCAICAGDEKVLGDVTINGNLTAETTGDKYFCIVGKKVTLIGGTMTITSVTNAVVSYGDMILGGDITASATDDYSGAFNTRDGGNLLIQEGSTINALSAGFGIYAAGNITMPNGSLTARGYSNATVQSNSGNISLTGTINVKGKDCAICAGDEKVLGDVTINGNLTAETTGDKYFCIVGKKVTLIGGTMKITSVTNAVVSYGNLKVTGNAVVTSTDPLSVALNSRDGGHIVFGKGDYKIAGAGYAVYAAGNIAFNTSLAILTPTNGKIYNHTIVDEGNNTATFVHIGYTPKVTQNVLSATNTVKYGEQLRIEGTIKAIGQTNYKLQESADGTTWRTIKSGTIATNDARTGHTVQYKKVLTETGYEAYRQYRMIANHVGSGEQDTSAIKRVYYKYPLFRDGFVTAYYGADETFNYAKPADCRDYRYTSNLPARVQENSDYLKITMPACPLYIDEYTPTYKVDFYDADATLLKSEEVIAGNDATPPAMDGQHAPASDPSRAKKGTFTGWSKDYTNVHKPLNVFAKYDVYVNLDMDMAEHICNRNEDWKFASWMFTQFENNKTMAMVGDSLTFRASVKTNTPVTVYFQSGAPLGNGEISWTTGTQVGEITGYDVNKVMTFDRKVTALVEYYNELPFERKRYYRFYAHGNGTAQTVYSETMEIQMYYPLLVNADQEVQVLTSEGGFYFNGLRSVIPVQYNETVLVLDRKGMKGAGLTLARVNKPAYLIEGYTDEGVHYMLGPGVTETLNVTTTKKLIVFDGVYGNGYPKQLDFTAEGFGKVNGYYGEVVPCGGSVTMPADPTEENAIFLGWSSWDPSSYDSLAYLNVPAISDNVLGFTANFEYYDPTPQYTVRFYGKDGAPLLDTQMVDEGKDATPPSAPEISGWHFTGWDKPYTTITEDVNITAIYGEDIKVWTVTYKNWDGSSLGSEQVNDGEAATGVEVAREGYTFVKWRDYFSGDDVDMQHITANITVEPVFTETLYTVTYRVNGVETYTVQAVHGLPASSIYYPLGTPTKEPTEALVYTFAYWTPDVETITEDVTFEAVFVPAPREYTVTFQNWDHTLLSEQQVAYGVAAVAPSVPARDGYFFDGWDRGFDVTLADMTVTAVFRLPGKYTISWLNDDASLIEQTVVAEGVVPTHADPTKQATAEFTYTFAGWSPEVVPVTGNATYTATYTSELRKYTVTFLDEDGNTLSSQDWDYGTTPTCYEPTKAATEQYTYTFAGWTPEVVAVKGNAIYTAKYNSTIRKYTITFMNGEDVLQSEEIEYGVVPTYKGSIPVKQEDEQYTYTFAGWTPEIVAVTGNATYTATYTSELRKYPITFLDEDGTTLSSQDWEYGTMPTCDEPTKPSTEQYTYTFAGWSPEVVLVTGNATYTATYTSELRKYTITFLNEDGTTLSSQDWEYGTTPTCDEPTKPSTEQYTYTFAGWSPEVVLVTGNATYTATYTSELRKYTITFLNEDGTTLSSQDWEYGTMPTCDEPTKPSTEQYTYTFAGWSPEVVLVTGNATYTATYTSELRKYTITFLDEDGTTLSSQDWEYGTMPTCDEPTKPSTEQYTYTFAGWSPEVVLVTGNATYTATYTSELRKYTITFLNEDGTTLSSQDWEYGTMPTCDEPTKPSTEQYTYTFAGWSPEVVLVSGDATYTATFTAEPIISNEVPEIQIGCQAKKIIRNGQLIIILDGVEYNAMGQEL